MEIGEANPQKDFLEYLKVNLSHKIQHYMKKESLFNDPKQSVSCSFNCKTTNFKRSS
jgi:hypothetical protein